MAKSICVEQTVEFPPPTLSAMPSLRHHRPSGAVRGLWRGGYRTLISYSDQSATEEFAQFFNVVFGNSSLLPGITVERINLSGNCWSGSPARNSAWPDCGSGWAPMTARWRSPR